MNYVIGEHFENLIRDQINTGRFNNASEVIREGLRLFEEREKKLNALKDHINSAIKREGYYTDQEIDEILSKETE